MHHFVDGFVVGTPFNTRDSLDGERFQDLVNNIQLACHHGGFVPRDAVST